MDKKFRGRFESKLDQKGRLSLPKGVLAVLPRPNSSINSSMVVTNSQYKGYRCLDVYTFEEWEKLEARISRLSPLQAEVQSFQRFYLAGGQVLEPDAQNRLLLPQTLRRYAQLEADTVIVGMGNKLELWSGEVWARLYEDLAGQFDQTLSVVAGLDDEKE